MKRQTSAGSAGSSLRKRRVAHIKSYCSLFPSGSLFVKLAPGLFAVLFAVPIACASPLPLQLGLPGAALLNSTTISTGIPILNEGRAPATNVEITTLTLSGSTLASPSLPFSLGSIGNEGAMTPLFASFTNPNAFPGAQYTLTVGGTYKVGTSTYSFTLTGLIQIPAAAPGSSDSLTGTVAPNPAKGPFPPSPPSLTQEDADIPGWVVPLGPVVPATPTASTAAQNAPLVAAVQKPRQSIARPQTVSFLLNKSLGTLPGHGFPIEPSGATSNIYGGGQFVVFVTANSLAAYSTDSGSTFTQLNPTTIFDNSVAGGFCCDQIVQYVPSIDRFVWLMQLGRGTVNGKKVGNVQRIAMAKPSDIVSNAQGAWTYWDISSADVGLGSLWMDYPDLAVGNSYLYASFDAVGKKGGGHMVVRILLSELKAGGFIHYRYTHPQDAGMAWGAHLTQNTGDTIFWTGQDHTSELRIFSWPESSTSFSWTDVPIFSWSNVGLSSFTPDSYDWMTKLSGFPKNAVIGATRSLNDLWLAWSAGTDSNFPQPHIEMVDLDISNNFKLKQQVQIWNHDHAFAYPALMASTSFEIGLSLEYGGNGIFQNHAVGFWGDFLVYITTSSNRGIGRYGDYVTIRQDGTYGGMFDAFGYGIETSKGKGDTHAVIFGR
jgi:hypothetical protein